MNFKFTKIKTIISVVIGLLAGIYSWYGIKCVGICPSNIVFQRLRSSVIGFLILVVIVYVIWSLSQKKK